MSALHLKCACANLYPVHTTLMQLHHRTSTSGPVVLSFVEIKVVIFNYYKYTFSTCPLCCEVLECPSFIRGFTRFPIATNQMFQFAYLLILVAYQSTDFHK